MQDENEEAGLCVDKTVDKEDRGGRLEPCVRGRVYAGSFLSNVPSALIAVATATTLTRVKDKATHAVVGITLADKIASQSGLSNIINGVDSEMDSAEIFDAEFDLSGPRVIKLPGWKGDAMQKLGRSSPTPAGFIVTGYFSDVVTYPPQPGQPFAVYTGKVVERYDDKPVGAKMNLCVGEAKPPDWDVVDQKFDATICPREPGDTTRGYTYVVIQRAR